MARRYTGVKVSNHSWEGFDMLKKLISKTIRLWNGEPKPEPEPEPEKNVYEVEEVWQLRIEVQDSKSFTYTHEDFRPLWRMYHWYLARDSMKYNIEYEKGMRIFLRDDIKTIQLDMVKANKRKLT